MAGSRPKAILTGGSGQGLGAPRTGVRAAAWLAWSLSAVALGMLALQLSLIFLGSVAGPLRGGNTWPGQAAVALGLVGAPILGGLLASRRPRNPYGWVWLGFAIGYALSTSAETYASYTLVADPASLLPDRQTVSVIAGPGWLVGTTLLPFLLLLFPDGKLPSRRWRVVAWVVAVAAGLGAIIYVLYVASDWGFTERIFPAAGNGLYYLSLTAVPLSAISLVFRYRRASGVQRQQLKWFAYAAVGVGCAQLVGVFHPWDLIGLTSWYLLFAASISGLYVATGIAVLRHQLYDIDIVINRTLVYGLLTLALAATYVGSVLVLQSAFRNLTDQESQLAIVASTLAIAALFNPLRHRIQA
ncbi:MAG: hypothetical protein ACRDTR_15865, partial [Rubrobacter sp.]